MGYVKLSFIPEGNVSLAVVDYRINAEIEAKLTSLGIELIKTVKCKELYEAVDGHPDMMMFHLGGNRMVLAPNIYEEIAPRLEKKGFAVTKGATWLVRNYPGNIAYNVLRLGDLVFHNIKYTDPELIRQLEKDNTEFINVSQGYTKCSVCVLDSRTIITSDRKIAETVGRYGVESLLIKPGGISLKGLSYGFIGGASGLLSNKNIAFTGSIENMEDYTIITEFIKSKGFEIAALSNERPMDYGSIIPIKVTEKQKKLTCNICISSI